MGGCPPLAGVLTTSISLVSTAFGTSFYFQSIHTHTASVFDSFHSSYTSDGGYFVVVCLVRWCGEGRMTFDVDRSAFSAERDTGARGINVVCIHFMTSCVLAGKQFREGGRERNVWFFHQSYQPCLHDCVSECVCERVSKWQSRIPCGVHMPGLKCQLSRCSWTSTSTCQPMAEVGSLVSIPLYPAHLSSMNSPQ